MPMVEPSDAVRPTGDPQRGDRGPDDEWNARQHEDEMGLRGDGARRHENGPPPVPAHTHDPRQHDGGYQERDREVGVPHERLEDLGHQPHQIEGTESDDGASQPPSGRPDRLDGDRHRRTTQQSATPQRTVSRIDAHRYGQQPEQQRPGIEDVVPDAPCGGQHADQRWRMLGGLECSDGDGGEVATGRPSVSEDDEHGNQNCCPYRPVAYDPRNRR